MGKTLKANIDLYVTALVQILCLAVVPALFVFIGSGPYMVFMPFINAFLIYVSFKICPKICRAKALIIIWLITLLVSVVAVLCLVIYSNNVGANWELGVYLVLTIHFGWFTLPYLFGVIYSLFKHIAEKKKTKTS